MGESHLATQVKDTRSKNAQGLCLIFHHSHYQLPLEPWLKFFKSPAIFDR